jgi:excisionase family DNA binding protein
MSEEREPRPHDLMTTGEAARVLGLSPDMVRLLERDGRLPAQRTTNGLRLFRRGDVEKLAATRAQTGRSDGSSLTLPNRRARSPRSGARRGK